MTMALGKRKQSRQRRYERPTGRGWREPERKTEQSHVQTVRPLGAVNTERPGRNLPFGIERASQW